MSPGTNEASTQRQEVRRSGGARSPPPPHPPTRLLLLHLLHMLLKRIKVGERRSGPNEAKEAGRESRAEHRGQEVGGGAEEAEEADI